LYEFTKNQCNIKQNLFVTAQDAEKCNKSDIILSHNLVNFNKKVVPIKWDSCCALQQIVVIMTKHHNEQ